MKKQILGIVLGIALLTLASALSISAGETYYRDLTGEVENLQDIECNLSVENYGLEGAELITNETGFILTLDVRFKPDNLTVDCILNGETYVSDSGGSSGGDSDLVIKYYNWDCTSWGNCIDGIANRTCNQVKVNYETVLKAKPDENITCGNTLTTIAEPIALEEPKEQEEVPQEIEELKKEIEWKYYVFALIILIVLSIMLYRLMRGKEKKEEVDTETLKKLFNSLGKEE